MRLWFDRKSIIEVMSRQCRTIFQIIFLFCINFELCKKRSRKSTFVVLHPSFAQLTNSWKMHLQWTATTFAKEIPAPATSAWLWWDTLSKPEPSQNEKSHYWLWWYVTCLLYSVCYQTSNFYVFAYNESFSSEDIWPFSQNWNDDWFIRISWIL